MLNAIRELGPTLDSRREFIFFDIRKNASTAIQRHALRDRCIVKKDNPEKWERCYRLLRRKDLDKILKFAVIRNPWDRVLSGYSFMVQSRKRWETLSPKGFISEEVCQMNFSEFLQLLYTKGPYWHQDFVPQHNRVYWQNISLVNFLIRFETLAHDWSILRTHLTDIPKHLVVANASNHSAYREHYNSEGKKIVQELYAKDIECFGYDF